MFTGTIGAEERYTKRIGDEAIPTRFFRGTIDAVVSEDGIVNFVFLPGFETLNLPGIAQTGLSQEDFLGGVHPTGSFKSNIKMNLAMTTGPTFGECRENLENGEIVGDANLDGQFYSRDLVTIFQAGEYADAVPDNSTWSEGDWTCDGDFDTDDLVAAFQAGQFEVPAAALAIRAYDGPLAVRSFGDKAGALSNRVVLDRPIAPQRNWLDTMPEAGAVYDAVATIEFNVKATDELMAESDTLLLELP